MLAYNFGDSRHNLTKFYQVMWLLAVVITTGVGAPYKIWERKHVQNSARFVTTFDFDRKYLRNGSTYLKS